MNKAPRYPFSDKQLAFLRQLAPGLDFSYRLPDDDYFKLDEILTNKLMTEGFEEDYAPNETGRMCESILDILAEDN